MKMAALGVRLFLIFAGIGCSESGAPAPAPAPATTPNQCVPGQQIACACPGTGMGVQVCNDEGSGLNACDCGRPIFDASNDRAAIGAGGGSMSTNDATSSDAGSIVDSPVDQDGSSTSPDDPCPTAQTVVNCSSTCPNMQTCTPITTPKSPCGGTSVVEVDTRASPKAVLRTPSLPSIVTCPNCPDYPAFAMRIVDKGLYDFTASVSPPWELMVFKNGPCGTIAKANCLRSAGGALTIFTYDPNAPSRNVTFDVPQLQCPPGDAQ